MVSRTAASIKVAPLGESALLVFFENRISPAINHRVHHLKKTLQESGPPGIIDLVPAYASLLITFDPDRLTHTALQATTVKLLTEASYASEVQPEHGKEHIVPVQYGGDAGPDFEGLAKMHDISMTDLIRL